MSATLSLEPAVSADIAAVAALFARSRAAALPFLPVLHTPEEDVVFLAAQLHRSRMTLARLDTCLVGFMVEEDRWVEQLYLDPDHRRQHIGSQLLGAAQASQPELSLWCFAENLAGLAFYNSHGFIEQRRTAGDNEAGLPDVLLHWRLH